ncbi:MAG: tRNA-dihydrouridine synthase family protein [Thermodesulfobacteria bacterium]|nr:tRNA-dihydrouridine synthase family protein [Thermodesulfobacteriota bacterium]
MKRICSHKVKIGNLEISPPLFLAPMAGLTHSGFRQLLLDFGGVGLLSTEMLSATTLPHENPAVSPYLIRTEREHPMSYQLLVYREEHLDEAIKKIEGLGAQAVDVNLGCGAPKVVKKGGGVGLAHDRPRLKAIVSRIKSLTELPVTVKIRLGQGPDREKFLEWCLFLEDLGIDGLYIHARYDKEPFARPPKWEMAALAKERLTIPVIVNGGIFSVDDAKRCLEITGADGIMIGRGAAIKPWLFRDIDGHLFAKSQQPLPKPDLPATWLRFFDYLEELFPPQRRLGRLKEFTHYFSQNYAFGNRLAMAVQRSKEMEEARARALEFFSKNPDTRPL